ncbi:MAG: tRNA (N6-threonylcarbamoyladenosine(37)-N6)-methyltransferase TrmO [Ruminococcaceae bacterium]|nr:tRNA (N6-threonylcarbamoyladenosine(37)-N6)-methyltransferase TrmO [Oscillospiraceae bacterium]
MSRSMEIKPVARIENDFSDKFAVPRQSGLSDIESKIVFEKEYSDKNALKGIEGFSHLWLIWGFSENIRESHSLTVRPPLLGGNERVGVFASRSPFRPNNLGLSCVKLERIENGVLIVKGADLINGTPIYDIKPYIPYSDCKSDAKGGFTESREFNTLEVEIEPKLSEKLSEKQAETLKQILKNDPRPAYHEDESRVYGFKFADFEVKFMVEGNKLKVIEIE